MKKGSIFLTVLFVCFFAVHTQAQCSMCTKTAQQMGEKPAAGLNSGILYLMFAPLTIIGYVGFRWWRSNKASEAENA